MRVLFALMLVWILLAATTAFADDGQDSNAVYDTAVHGDSDDIIVITTVDAGGTGAAAGTGGKPSPSGGGADAGGGGSSGTNPADFLYEVRLFNEYQELPGDNNRNFTTLRLAAPFADGAWSFRVDLPMVAADLNNNSEIGFGDAMLQVGTKPWMSPKAATILQAKLYMDTASEDMLGAGKWRLGLVAIEAFFLDRQTIFAPAYEHQFSFAGDDNRPDMEIGAIDLYFVYAPSPANWIIIDPTLTVDYNDNNRVSSSLEIELGQQLGGGASVYVRPGFGLAGTIGSAEPYDWNMEVGLKKVWK